MRLKKHRDVYSIDSKHVFYVYLCRQIASKIL